MPAVKIPFAIPRVKTATFKRACSAKFTPKTVIRKREAAEIKHPLINQNFSDPSLNILIHKM